MTVGLVVVPEGYDNFFVASATVAGALIGLLFVATAIAPERVLHKKAPALAQETAAGAFILLSNTLFVSLAALIPQNAVGTVLIIVGVGGIIGTLMYAMLTFVHRDQGGVNPMWWFRRVLMLALLGWQIAIGIHITSNPTGDLTAPFANLATIILVFFAIGVERAWVLLGGQGHGVGDAIRMFRREKAETKP